MFKPERSDHTGVPPQLRQSSNSLRVRVSRIDGASLHRTWDGHETGTGTGDGQERGKSDCVSFRFLFTRR
jgi:hypothetical protein